MFTVPSPHGFIVPDASFPPETSPKKMATAEESPPLPIHTLPPCLFKPLPSISNSFMHLLFYPILPSLQHDSPIYYCWHIKQTIPSTITTLILTIPLPLCKGTIIAFFHSYGTCLYARPHIMNIHSTTVSPSHFNMSAVTPSTPAALPYLNLYIAFFTSVLSIPFCTHPFPHPCLTL